MGSISYLSKIMAKTSDLSIRDYFLNRNKVLFLRKLGGLGDILMTRMLYEDAKKLFPDIEIIVACPKQYHDALQDHPFIDRILDYKDVNISEFITVYDISTVCGKYEKINYPNIKKHRSDIWADHCGFKLTKHNMHLQVDDNITLDCRRHLNSFRNGKSGYIVLMSPSSSSQSRNLSDNQANEVIKQLNDMGHLVVCLHNKNLDRIIAPTVTAKSISEFLGYVNAADYVISVDTSTFHAAGGLDKPTVAVFSWSDGKIIGKWFDRVILVQRHRDNGNWSCGPCYLWQLCPKETKQTRKPCITEISSQEIVDAFKEMVSKWPVKMNIN